MSADESAEKLIEAVKQDETVKVYEILSKNTNILQNNLIFEFFQNLSSVEMLQLFFEYCNYENIKSCISSMFSMSMITFAIMHFKSIEIIMEIVKKGEDINAFDGRQRTPLIESLVSNRDVNFVEKLIVMGADVNKCNSYFRSPLHFANKKDTVCLLLKYGACVNQQDDNGQTALLRALELNRDKDLIIELIEGGANLQLTDENDNSVLHLTNDLELLEYFLRNDVAPINGKNNKGQTPLMKYIKEHKNINLIITMLENGSDPNALDSNYNTPLHYAYNCELVNLLIYYGGNINAKNKYNHSPFHTIFHHRPIAFSFGFSSTEAIIKHTLLSNDCEIPNDTGCSENIIAAHFRLLIEDCKKELNKMKELEIIKNLTFYNFCTFKKTKYVKFINMSPDNFLYGMDEIEKFFPNFNDIILMKIKRNELEKRKHKLCKLLNRICLGSRSIVELDLDDFNNINDEREPFDTPNENSGKHQYSLEDWTQLDYDSLCCVSSYLSYHQLSKLFLASM